jgi:ribosomal protein S4E
MRVTPRRPHVPAAIDIMRPSQVFAAPPASGMHDARRWMALVFLTLAGAALLPLLVGASRALVQ